MKYTIIIMVLSILLTLINLNAQNTEKNENKLQVTIMIFSGRPDPTFSITDENVIKRLEGMLSNLSRSQSKFKENTVIPSILGYRGIRVENKSSFLPEIESFSVHKSDVELMSKSKAEGVESAGSEPKEGEKVFLMDAAQSIEDMLINLGLESGAIDSVIVDIIKKSR